METTDKQDELLNRVSHIKDSDDPCLHNDIYTEFKRLNTLINKSKCKCITQQILIKENHYGRET